MEWPGLNDITPQRRPRRASTFPARFTQPGQPEVRVEQIGPRYEIWPAAGDASRRGLVSEYEDPPDWDYPRRYRSSSRERIVPVIEVDSESTRPKSVRHNSRFTSREGRRRRKHTRSISPPRVMGISPPRDRSKSSSEDGSSNPSYSSVPYEDYRRSSRRHRSRVRYDSSDESEGEWDVNQRAYTFSLPRRSRSPNSQDSVLKRPTEPSIKTESNSELQVGIDGPKLGTTLRVFSSKYTGEGSVGGSQSAQMKVIHDQKKGQSPLFRWIHFEDPTMHFDDFQNKVTQIPGLTDIERIGLTKLLGRVRKKYDKPLQTSKGLKVRSMEPGSLQETLSRGDRPKDKLSKAKTALWLCLPYFWLGEYSGVLSAPRSGAHPIRTLLQARFSSVGKERDLQQAVCNVPGTPPGFCFHIAQLWCLVLDDSLLITCARMPMSALQGDAISVIADPMPVQSKAKKPRILVSYGGSVLWLLLVDDCQTYFSFISNFLEFWPRKFRILHNGKVITAQDWPRIINLATYTSNGIRLALQIGSSPKVSTHGILNSSPRSSLPSNSTAANADSASHHQDEIFRASASVPAGAAGERLHPPVDVHSDQIHEGLKDGVLPKRSASPATTLGGNDFHVFTWLSFAPWKQSHKVSNINFDQLKEDLEDMDFFLSHKTTLVERLAYRECPEVSRLEVYGLLEQEERTLVESGVNEQNKDEKKSRIYELRVDVVNAAESIFQFFLPSLFEGPTVLKYWGVIHQLLVEASSLDRPNSKRKDSRRRPRTEADSHPTERELEEISGELEALVRHTQPFRDLVSQAQAGDRLEIKIPDELLKAWLHIIMSLINYTRANLWEDQMNTCAALVEEGMKKVVQSLNRTSLLEKSVFMPSEVASLINFQLLQDLTGNQSSDICETYSVYLRGLEAEVEANPLNRSHQDRITLLKQEISVITETLQKQRNIFAAITTSTQAQNSHHKTYDGRHTQLAYEYGYDRTRPTREDEHYYSRSRVEPVYRPRMASGYSPLYRAGEDLLYVPEIIQDPQSQLSPTDPGGYRDLLLQDCCDLIDKRIQDFEGMDRKATDLETWNIQKIDSNKDRQESAVYAFTIVTIVFLPLSTVASIMGMNTNDIRNMRLNQWVFWAVALPLASVVITLCLLWAGELANFRRGFVGLWGRGRAGDARGGGGGLVDARETDHRRARRLEAEIAGLEAEREFVGRQMRRERSDLYGNRRYDYV